MHREATGLWQARVTDDRAGCKYGIRFLCSCALCSVVFCLEEEVNPGEG